MHTPDTSAGRKKAKIIIKKEEKNGREVREVVYMLRGGLGGAGIESNS